MAIHVGETQSEIFIREGGAGESFTRTDSFIDGVSTTFNPTFTDLGDGVYRYTYAPSAVGFHEWAGTGDQGPPLTINFDVDPITETVITPTIVTSLARSSTVGGGGGPLPYVYPRPLIIVQGADWYWHFRLKAGGQLIDTTAYGAAFTVRATLEGGQELFASVNSGHITVGFDPAPWEASTAYGLGQQAVPTTLNGYLYQVTVADTSDSSEPTWPTTIGGTVVDGGVTWACVATDAGVTNLRIALAPADTDAVEPWGYGYFDVQIIDEFAHEYFIVEGNAALRRAMTRPAA